MKTLLAVLALLAAATPAAAQKTRSFDADSSKVYELREVTTGPRPLNIGELREALEAGYPPHLRAAAVSGSVEVRLRVDTRGVPHDLRVTRSTDAAFDEPTLQALRTLRFSPARLGEKPVTVWVVLPIQWTVAPDPAGV